jgi:hypothetical protein
MLDICWRLGITVMILVALITLGPGLSPGAANRLIEEVLGQTPRARIAEYLGAIAQDEGQAALDRWSPAGPENPDLEARRQAMTTTLLAYGPNLAYQVLETEWWRTCCEPGVIDDAGEAGGARVRVRVWGKDLPERVYVFDLLVPGGYWGAAMGNPLRTWAIYDVYPEGQPPLVLTW